VPRYRDRPLRGLRADFTEAILQVACGNRRQSTHGGRGLGPDGG
jgi:hypothetical protein